jgi:hypothetical protein
MMQYLHYLFYLLKHKFWVFYYSCKLGIPVRGLLHDLSKFRPDEFFPYANNWFDRKGKIKKLNYDDKSTAFGIAWGKHQRRNEHHWQYWVIEGKSPCGKARRSLANPMPEPVAKEMLADWCGAARAKKQPNVRKWYQEHKDEMTLHLRTRRYIEFLLEGIEV